MGGGPTRRFTEWRPAKLSESSGPSFALGGIAVPWHMKTFLSLLARRLFLLALLALQTAFACGCTSALWNEGTFAHYYRPGTPANLRASYSKERQDILVQYSEAEDGDTKTRRRYYWLEPNTLRVNRNRKPHFVSANTAHGLTPLPVCESAPNPPDAGPTQLSVVIGHGDDYFTLYSGTERLDAYKLPVYPGSSQRVKQILLTPFAVTVDATIIGAVISYYSAPQILSGLNR